MNSLQIIYIISTLIAIIASIPQIRQLYRTKRSDELSIPTWTIWLVTQFVTLAYISTVQDPILTAVASTWVLFYVVMISLIMYYRRHPGVGSLELAEERAES
jgi:uncharacterized protein with PQ loop repeat